MGITFEDVITIYCKDLFYEIKNLTKDKKILEIKDITTKLVDFLMSDTYIFVRLSYEEEYKNKTITKNGDSTIIKIIFKICENFEKFISIKCLFPLIEELKKSKFENQINKVIKLLNNQNERDDFKKNFSNQHPTNFQSDGDLNIYLNTIKVKNNDQYFDFLAKIATFLIYWLILGKQKITNPELIEEFFQNLKTISSEIRQFSKKEELKELLNDLLALNYPLQNTKEINNLFITALNFIIFSYDKLETFNEKETNMIYYNIYHLYPVYLEIKSIIKNKKILNMKAIITKLAEFYKSDKFILLGMRSNFIKEFHLGLFIPIFIICENIENYLSIKCLFPLIEELKKSKFEEQINRIIQLSKNDKERKNFGINYYEQHQKEEDFTIESRDYIENCNLILKQEKITILGWIIIGIFLEYFKYEGCLDIRLDKENLINIFFSGINPCHEKFGKEFKDIKELLNFLMKLDYPLENTNEIYQLFICACNIFISFEKLKDKFDENIVQELKKILCDNNVSENNICIIYEKNEITDKSHSKYNISYYAKKKAKDNKMSILFLEKIEKKILFNTKYIYINLFNDEEISEDEFNKFKNDNIDDNKMKRFPFELNENEKLISIIFTNSAREFHCSIICKNTDRFSTLEPKLYEKFPQYGETANYFIANGNNVISHKTLEENNIKDSDIVILHQFEA